MPRPHSLHLLSYGSCVPLVLCILSMIASPASSQPEGAPVTSWYQSVVYGKAFYYGPYTGAGACSLDSPTHIGVPPEIEGVSLTVAMNVQQYDMGSCGMCIQITGSGIGSGGSPIVGTIDAYVNNMCPECKWGELDIGKSGDGVWDITWKAVPCNLGSNAIQYQFEGSNEYYLKLQARVTRCPVKLLRVQAWDGQWIAGHQTQDKFFEFSDGPFSFPLTVEATSIFDDIVIDAVPILQNDTPQMGTNGVQFTCASASPTPSSSSSSSSIVISPPTTTARPSSHGRRNRAIKSISEAGRQYSN